MPGDTGRGRAVPRQTRARAAASTGVGTQQAGSSSARVPAPAPEAEPIEEEASGQERPEVLTGGVVGASGRESSSSGDEYSTAQQDTPARDTDRGQVAARSTENERGAAGVVDRNPGEGVGENVFSPAGSSAPPAAIVRKPIPR